MFYKNVPCQIIVGVRHTFGYNKTSFKAIFYTFYDFWLKLRDATLASGFSPALMIFYLSNGVIFQVENLQMQRVKAIITSSK